MSGRLRGKMCVGRGECFWGDAGGDCRVLKGRSGGEGSADLQAEGGEVR